MKHLGILIAVACMCVNQAHAQQTRIGAVTQSQSQIQPIGAGSTASQTASTANTDTFTAQIWGLTAEEVQRAKLLLKGPRANFSIPNLSPIEALGIHARSDAERRKYAEMFARAQHADTERVLAWMYSYQEAMQRLYPNEKVIDFSAVPKAPVDVGTAEAANVPRSAIQVNRRGDAR